MKITTYEAMIAGAVSFNTPDELAGGFLRYEAVRKLTPSEFQELWARSLHGENFDAMIDELAVLNEESQP